MSHNHQKKIAVINDLCGFGRCSLTVSLPIISALKVQCCPMPTAVFSNHTAFDSHYCADFTGHMDAYLEQWDRLGLGFDGILTGYLGSPEQIDIVRRFFLRFKRESTIAVIDPVMGDSGRLYSDYSPSLAEQMGSLVCFADILTPNLTEACILTGTQYRPDMDTPELTRLCRQLSDMGPKKVVISGLDRGDRLDNFVFEAGKTPVICSQPKIGPCRCGTGDVFASILAADAVNQVDLVPSVEHACAFLAKVLGRAVELDIPTSDGICFEEFLTQI